MDLKEKEWNESYNRKENFVFYPHEEVIRFVSKYIKQKQGINSFIEKQKVDKALVLGCGIGRHVLFLDDFDIESHGIDLSNEAIEFAQKWFKSKGREYLNENLVVGTSTDLPYNKNMFDFIISHGVIDSMDLDIAKKTISEANRVLKSNGLFYFDLITNEKKEAKKKIVKTSHEKGTVQYYYNDEGIDNLLNGLFEIKEKILVKRTNLISEFSSHRYHIIAEKI